MCRVVRGEGFWLSHLSRILLKLNSAKTYIESQIWGLIEQSLEAGKEFGQGECLCPHGRRVCPGCRVVEGRGRDATGWLDLVAGAGVTRPGLQFKKMALLWGAWLPGFGVGCVALDSSLGDSGRSFQKAVESGSKAWGWDGAAAEGSPWHRSGSCTMGES